MVTDDKIVKFPDDRIIRQETTVSLEKIKEFLRYIEIAEQCGATTYEAVVFPNIDCFEMFCEKLLESK